MADFYLYHLVIHPLDPLDEGNAGGIWPLLNYWIQDTDRDFVVDYLHKGEALLESGYKVGVWRSGFRIIDLGMLFKVKKISFTFEQDDEAKTEESDIQDDSSDKEPFTLKTVGEPFTKILTEEIDEDDDGKVLLFFVEMVSPVDEQEKEEAILQLAHLRTAAPKVLVKFLESKLTIIYEDADRSLSPEV